MQTPILQQQAAIEKMYPGVVLVFRIADTFTFYGKHALTAAAALDATCTLTRPEGASSKATSTFAIVGSKPAEDGIAIMISKGHKVAVCEQVGGK